MPSATKPAPATRRSRAVSTTQSDTDRAIAADVTRLASEFFNANVIANEHAAKANKARAALLALCKTHGIATTAACVVTPTGAEVPVDISVEAKPRDVVDVEKLHGLVDGKTFMQCVSASQTQVKQVAGEAVLAAVKTTVLGEENVNVKARKK